MTKNSQEFKDFLRDEVNLNRNRRDRLETSVGAVDKYLAENLTGYQKMEPQGSYALGTLIKPVDDNDEYDADIQIVMNPNDDWDPKDYVNEVHGTLKDNDTYSDKMRRKTRCATIDYAGDFHLDVVPRVTEDDQHHVCNRIENEFEVTDGTGYREWFIEKNRITDGNLRRVVRLLKYLRDHKNNYTVKSILLTTLAGYAIEPEDEGTETVRTVADTLVTVLTRMDDYLQEHSDMPDIENPVLSSETFNRHWDQTKYANFRNRVHSHAQTAAKAKDETSREKSVETWRELFGEKFGKGIDTENSADGRSTDAGGPASASSLTGLTGGSASATTIPVVRRLNEARRFG